MPSSAQLPGEVHRWVQNLVHADIVTCQRASGGLSRIAFAIETDAASERSRHLFLMMEGADKSGGNAHDATVLAALNRLGACVPVFLGLHASSNALLMEQLSGTSDFSRLSAESTEPGGSGTSSRSSPAPNLRTGVGRDLMAQLARIHRLPLAQLDLGSEIANEDYMEEQFAHMERMQEALGPDVFIEYGLRWLQAQRPDESARRCLVHGDIGPGNFVFDAGRVTGIVDWEIAHVGNPMEDLAALSIRNLSKPIGRLPELFAAYSQATGEPLDISAIEYFRIFILLRNSLLIRTKLQSPIPDPEVARQLRTYEAFLLRCATDCLCHWYGLAMTATAFGNEEIPPPPRSSAAFDPALMKQHLSYFVRRAEGLCLERSELMGALLDVHMPPLRARPGAPPG